jgi:hypothetical protein
MTHSDAQIYVGQDLARPWNRDRKEADRRDKPKAAS